ncbi:hypothetical protein PMAYCL1PPCAC_14244, partial [Pristionchus mayeri]
VEVEKRRRSNRNISGRVKYTDYMEESDREEEPSVKKKRSESVESMDKIIPKKMQSSSKRDFQSKTVRMSSKDSEDTNSDKNEVKCPECEYSSRSAYAWWKHLKVKHSTTPTLAGCLLRCDCGNESFSFSHSHECEISNFTVIRKGNGPIRRLQVTPQCILCKKYPKTPCGYTEHLKRSHKTTLKKNGIYLICACGLNY